MGCKDVPAAQKGNSVEIQSVQGFRPLQFESVRSVQTQAPQPQPQPQKVAASSSFAPPRAHASIGSVSSLYSAIAATIPPDLAARTDEEPRGISVFA